MNRANPSDLPPASSCLAETEITDFSGLARRESPLYPFRRHARVVRAIRQDDEPAKRFDVTQEGPVARPEKSDRLDESLTVIGRSLCSCSRRNRGHLVLLKIPSRPT